MKNNRHIFLTIAGIGAALFLFLSCLTIFYTTTFGSPDEAGNDFFIRHLASTGQYSAASPLTAEQLAVFRSRSSGVRGNTLVPASFFGLVEVGATLNRVGGDRAYLLLTPILALAALIALYRLFRYFWSQWWSLLGVVLVAAHPVWWQFQTLPAFHNGAFVSLLIITGLALKQWHLRPAWGKAALLGIVYGSALAFRPVEALWTGPLIAIMMIAMPGGWRHLLLTAGLTVLMQAPWLLANSIIYGGTLATAYTPSGILGDGVQAADRWQSVRQIFTPPGGWSWHWLSSAWWYLILLVPAWSVMALASLSKYFRSQASNKLKIIKLSLVTLFVVSLLVYYGSWNLYPLEPASRIGSLASYARYWLPLYVAMSAGVIVFLRRLWTRSHLATAIIVAGLFISQIVAIVWHPSSGLLARFDRDQTAQAKRQIVLSVTAADALIIAGQSDKYYLNDRPVAFSLPTNTAGWETLRKVRSERPVYLYVTPRQYRRESVQSDLQTVGLKIGQIVTVQEDQLWEITL